jgi:hypothetical protein
VDVRAGLVCLVITSLQISRYFTDRSGTREQPHRGPGDGDSEMALAGAGSADEHGVALLGKEGTRCGSVAKIMRGRAAPSWFGFQA